jgi:predicted metal-binding membrane protein
MAVSETSDLSKTAAPLDPSSDTPKAAYSVLQLRATLVTAAILAGLAGIAWWSTAVNSRGMGSMVLGLTGVGRAMPFEMSVFVFLGMWTAMMVAMMFPAVAPILLLHRMVLRKQGRSGSGTVLFATGYLLVWVGVGLIPLGALVAFRHVADGSIWLDRASGAVLVLAGLYQFSTWKETCLKACRTPLSFLMTHDFGSGPYGAVRVGISHGLYCFGCCWALMAVLFVVGLMNLIWMAATAVVFLAEKNWKHGVGLTRVVGVLVIAFGLAVLVDPALLGGV